MRFLLAILVTLAPLTSSAVVDETVAAITAAGPTKGAAALYEKAAEQGEVRVIVHMKGRDRSVADMQTQVADAMAGQNAWVVRQFDTVPAMVMQADADGIAALARQPNVVSIVEDVVFRPALSQSTAFIGATNAWASGYTGNGQAVAILDTGVETTHGFLSGRTVAEACFSSNSANTVSFCPNGQESQTGPGAGFRCTSAISGCDHGTHVAGIALGSNGNNLHGVARDADLIAIQVFSQFNDAGSCSPRAAPCALAYFSDIMAGMEHVLLLSNTYNVASLNASIGGGVYPIAEDCDAIFSPLKQVVDNLNAAGIGAAISSGNNSSATGMSAPGCISTATSVGATADSSNSIAGYSNGSSWLDILAPGSSIFSSVYNDGFGNKNGTSMASPHVAGAYAVLRSAKPTASVDEMLAAMQNTGVNILDTGNSMLFPRLQLDDAIDRLLETPIAVNKIADDDYEGGVTAGSASADIASTGAYKGQYTRLSGAGPDQFRFIPQLPVAGLYEIFTWWPTVAGNSPQARFTITHAGGVNDVDVDQTATGQQWHSLGQFPLNASGTIVDISDPLNDSVVVDALRFVSIPTAPNQPPVINALSATPDSIRENETSQLSATVDDPDNGPNPLSYSWTASAGSFNNPNIANPVYTPPSVGGGQLTVIVTLTVSDGEDSDVSSINITVRNGGGGPANQPPVINSLSATPNSIDDNQTSQLAASATDPDAGPSPLSYSWSASAGTFNNASIANPVFIPPNVTGAPQNITVTLTVSDGEDTDVSSIGITVSDYVNQPPVINSLSANPSSINDTQTSQLAASATDPDSGPGPLSYSWSASAGTFNNASIANPVFIPPDVTGAPQNITVTLTVSDGEDTDVDSLTITVSDATAANLPPSITDLSAPGFHRYTLSLAYSPRFPSPADTNNVEVWFDGQLLSTLSGTVAGWQTFDFDVQPGGDSAQIELRGAGTSDGAGGYVDAVALYLTGTAEANRVVNGSFETHPPLTNGGGRWNVFNSIDGWTATVDQIEVQSNLVSPAAFDGNAKVEMDAAVNATIVQTVATAEATMLDNETATLDATANDPDAGPNALSYSWSTSAGSFDDPSAAAPVFTPPDVATDTTVTISLTVSDGEDTDSRSFDIVVRNGGAAPPPPNQPPVINSLSANPEQHRRYRDQSAHRLSHRPGCRPRAR